MTQVFNEDCEAGMSRYPDGYFDLAICDPPYGIGAGRMAYVRNGNKTVKQKNGKKLLLAPKQYTVVFGTTPHNTPGTAAPRKLRLLQPSVPKYPGTNRNAACPCGSGKKYKKCCL